MRNAQTMKNPSIRMRVNCMKTIMFAMLFCLCVLAGCRTESPDCLSSAVHPDAVGGVPIGCLVREKDGVDTLRIKLDEIILSNGTVNVVCCLKGLPDRELTINERSILTTLACAILVDDDIGYFRLVSNMEFAMVNPLPMDRAFAISKLHVGEGDVKISYSYAGFPSNAGMDTAIEEMNIQSKFHDTNHIRYYIRNIVDVRFSDKDYSYPNEEYSSVNIGGEGSCIMRVEGNASVFL